MRNIIENLISDKKVLILGFGREGKSTYNILKSISKYKELAIADMNNVDIDGIKVYFGDKYLDAVYDYDVIFKSPGVVLPYKYYKNRIVTSEIEIFLKKYGYRTIGITGTKGKSTVSSLIHHTFDIANIKNVFAGNIGLPVFDIIDKIDDDMNIVLELSSHQLEYCKYSPHMALFLNIYEEHLDHYVDFNAYFEAKKNIYLHQNENDILICDETVKPNCMDYKGNIEIVNTNVLPYKNLNDINGIKLIGEHNYKNTAFAYMVVKHFGISDEMFIKSLVTFEPLHHRLELVGSVNGLDYYDDSISTTAESCIAAIKSIKNIGTVLIGGMDRGINYNGLINYLKISNVNNIIFMYASGNRIYNVIKNDINGNSNIYYCDDLANAVKLAKEITNSGKAVLLSPASASYGYFKNFEERGEIFKKLALS